MADKIHNPVKVRVERPRAQRFPFVASIELVDVQSEVKSQGRVTDLSLYGCGVTASKTFPAGTKLSMRIISKGQPFSALGKVAYATADVDMGIVVTRIEPPDQMLLAEWISELHDR